MSFKYELLKGLFRLSGFKNKSFAGGSEAIIARAKARNAKNFIPELRDDEISVERIHDLMSKARYGDMDAFIRKLKEMGYAEVRLIDTTDGTFMSKKEAAWLGLSGSTMLVGKK